MAATRLPHSELLELKRWNTPTIYNGWEQTTRHNVAADGFNLEECRDFMPQMGPMVGYAVTVQFEPSNPAHPKNNLKAWSEYLNYVASVPGPKIVVIQDLDKPRVIGAFWGEVSSNVHRALGCVGTIIDGGIRDLDEMNNAGFKAIARRLCVGHAHSCPVRWGCEVEVFGRTVRPGQLIHADKHGFLAIPEEDEARLLEAALHGQQRVQHRDPRRPRRGRQAVRPGPGRDRRRPRRLRPGRPGEFRQEGEVETAGAGQLGVKGRSRRESCTFTARRYPHTFSIRCVDVNGYEYVYGHERSLYVEPAASE